MDLHPGAAVAIALRRRVNVLRCVARAEEAAVQLCGGHSGDDRARRGYGFAVGQDDTRCPTRRDRDPFHARSRPQLSAGVADDPRERLDEPDTAADRDRHPAELDGAGDHLGHEAGNGVLGAEARVQHPRGEQPVGLLRAERHGGPVAAGRERATCEVQEAPATEPAEHPLTEPEAPGRPELGAEDAEREVGVRHELLELPLPGGTVAGRPAVELGDVRLHRRLQEHRRAVGVCRARRQVGVQILETAPVELVAELGVRRGAREERVPGAHHLVGEAGQRVVRLRADGAPEPVRPLEHADAPAVSGEERAGGERVDSRPDEDGVEPGHAARLPRSRLHDMSASAV